MPNIVTFDGPNKVIEEIDVAGDNVLDVVEIYSEWKVWVATSDNSKYLKAFEPVGGDPVSDTLDLGITYFLENGWRIRPAESNHKLVLVGNLYTRESGESAFLDTLGPYTVNVETQVSNLTSAVTARLDVLQLLEGVYIDTVYGMAGTGEDVGTPTNPVNNLADAFTIADRENLRSFKLRGEITLDRDYEDWAFSGIASETDAVIDLNGWGVNGTKFSQCTLTGMSMGAIDAYECTILMASTIAGHFRSCSIDSNVSVTSGGTAIFANCYSAVAGASAPIFNLNGAIDVMFRKWSGGIELINIAAPTTVSVDVDPGSITLGPTNIGGSCLVRGLGLLNDTSNGTTVNSLGLMHTDNTTTRLREIWQKLGLDGANNVTITDTSITFDGITITVDQPDANTTTLARS